MGSRRPHRINTVVDFTIFNYLVDIDQERFTRLVFTLPYVLKEAWLRAESSYIYTSRCSEGGVVIIGLGVVIELDIIRLWFKLVWINDGVWLETRFGCRVILYVLNEAMETGEMRIII